MKKKISILDFTFIFSGYGHYKVIYTSPVTKKQWTKLINNMPLIDRTKNADAPKQIDLNELKFFIKN